MKDTEDSERRIKNHSHLKQIHESSHLLELVEETECSVKAEENRHECSGIFPNHPHFVSLPVEVPDAHIIQSPEGEGEKRDRDCDPSDHKKLPGLNQPWGLFNHHWFGENLRSIA